MRIFKERNNRNPKDVCPICGKNTQGETVLIRVIGTQKGNLCEAKQFHLACLELTWDEYNQMIYQRIK